MKQIVRLNIFFVLKFIKTYHYYLYGMLWHLLLNNLKKVLVYF